jgi:hypothetical protein
VYRTQRPLTEPGAYALSRVGELGLEAVSDAEASPSGRFVAVRTSNEVVIYRSADFVRGGSSPHLRISIDGLQEAQGEGVALGDLECRLPA